MILSPSLLEGYFIPAAENALCPVVFGLIMFKEPIILIQLAAVALLLTAGIYVTTYTPNLPTSAVTSTK